MPPTKQQAHAAAEERQAARRIDLDDILDLAEEEVLKENPLLWRYTTAQLHTPDNPHSPEVSATRPHR